MGIINAECGKTVTIGYQGENKRQTICFNLSDIMTEFPGGTAVLAIRRHGDADIVPALNTELSGMSLLWKPTAWELANNGFLYAQVTYSDGDAIGKTKKYRFNVEDSLIVSGVEPEDWQDLVGQLVQAAADVMAAVSSYDAMTAEAAGLPAGSAPTAEIDHDGDNPVLKLGIPAGATGAQGPKGDKGNTGDRGPQGIQGEKGDSPVRGVDYWTAADQQAMREDIATDLAAAQAAIAGDKADALTAIGSAGTTQIGNVNTAGTTQVGNVNTAGTAQVGAVQAKGAEVIASIPSDYSELSADVSDLKNEIDALEGGSTGQVLRKKSGTDYDVEWASVAQPTDAQVAEAVDDWLDDHPEATTTVQDGSLTEAKFTAATLETIKNDFVTPEMFGAKGDGETDDAQAIQDAIDYCILNHKKLVFHTKTYGVIPYQQDRSVVIYNSTYYALLIKGSIEIDLNGCTIQVLENTIESFDAISIRDTSNVILKNGTIIGDRNTFTVSGENSQLLNISDSKYVLIDNIIMKDSKGDCLGNGGVQINQPHTTRPFSDFYMGNVIQNCIMKHSARHGITFSKGRGVTFYNCRIEDVDPTGVLSWSGSAVDMEPYYGHGSIFDIRFDSCSMTDNVNGPYIQHGDSVRFTNCYLQSLDFRGATNCMVENNIILSSVSINQTDAIIDGNKVSSSITIQNNINFLNNKGIIPEVIIRNNNCGRILFSSNNDNNKFARIIIENNNIYIGDNTIGILGNSSAETITDEVIISNNNIIKYLKSDRVYSSSLIFSISNIKSAIINGNTISYDVTKVGQGGNIIDANNIECVKFINNSIQRKKDQEEVSYVSNLRRVVKTKDVGTAIISGNIINPDNTEFGTMSIAMIDGETSTGGTDVKVVMTNNYACGVTLTTNTPDDIDVIVDNNNVMNNVAPYSSSSGVSF